MRVTRRVTAGAVWFPVLPADGQNPYDPGPYRKLPLVPIGPGQTGLPPGRPPRPVLPDRRGRGPRRARTFSRPLR